MRIYKINSLRLAITIFLVTGFGGCCDEYIPFWNISEMNVQLLNTSTNQFVDTSIVVSSREEFRIVISNEILYVSSSILHIPNFLVYDCYALSCPNPGEAGMKDPIISLNIYSDNQFNMVVPGEPLNEFVVVENSITIEELVQYSSTLPAWSGRELQLNFTVDPSTSSHTFTIEIETMAGNKYKAQTEMVTWN